jgi:two-component system LytT family response regulator
MSSLRVLTVDDERLALRRLQLLLSAMPGIEHIGDAASCGEAIERIDTLGPDVVLLDIKMRDGSGFDIAEVLAARPNPPAVVFVTAFDHFAIRAFETAATDYLLKPVERDRLGLALARARRERRAVDAEQRISELKGIIRNLRWASDEDGKSFETEFWLKSAGTLARVSIDSISCVSSEDDYVAIHTDGGSHLMRGSLRQFQNRVEPDVFVRVHRRWLVRKAAIAAVRTPRLGPSEVILRNGKRVSAGRVYLKQLKQALSAPAGL